MKDNEWKEKLEEYLTEQWKNPVRIESIHSLSGGACQENALLTIRNGNSPLESYIYRSDGGGSLLSSLSRYDEFRVARAAYEAGVKTPEPVIAEPDPTITGKPFAIMEKVDGKATGRFIVKDPSIAAARKNLADELAASLAKIHTITPENSELYFLKKTEPVALTAVQELRPEVEKLPGNYPAMELTLNWLEQRAVDTDQIVLVHGDFRTGNFMVNPEGLQGILDWEFAHFGDRHEDIAWLCMRDWRFGKTAKEAGGFADREEFYAAYEKYSGIKVSLFSVTYWEVMGNLRWAIGSAQQTERHLSGQAKGIELASIGRRTCEMEFEMMRLIENAG